MIIPLNLMALVYIFKVYFVLFYKNAYNFVKSVAFYV